MKKVKKFIELWKIARSIKGGTYSVITDSGRELIRGNISVFLWRIRCIETTAYSEGTATSVLYISAMGKVIHKVKI